LSKHAIILLLIVLASAVGLVTLGRYDLRPWDEPFYALRARAVAEDDAWLDQNDYCSHRMANACYPPLFVWLAGATMKVLGPGEFAARLWAALLGLAAIPVAYLLGTRLYGRTAGLYAAGALAALPNFVRASRMAQFDAPLAFFVLLTFWLWVEYYRNRKWSTAVLCGLAFGLALMTKIAVPFVFVAAAAAVVLSPGGRPNGMRDVGALALAVGVGLAVAAPWHVYMYAKHGDYFLGHYVGYVMLYRGDGIAPQIQPGESPLRFLFYYNSAVAFLKGVAPFFFVGLVALLASKGTWRSRPDRLAVVLWVVLSLAVLMVVRFKREIYLTPVLAPMCVVAGGWLAKLGRGQIGKVGAAVLAGTALFAGAWADSSRVRGPFVGWITPEFAGGNGGWLLTVAVAAAAAALAFAFYFWYRRAPKAAAATLLVTVYVQLAAGAVGQFVYGRRDWQPLKRHLEDAHYAGVVMVTADETPTHLFYLHRLMPGFGGAERLMLNPTWGRVDPAYVEEHYRKGYLVLLDKEARPEVAARLAAGLERSGGSRVESARYILFIKDNGA
jgi:4-amino-4-deoxy-L-arabinose transferase-like glycosyltransferase